MIERQIYALSLWEPWASLIVTGEKRIETRSWATSYRGRLLIHAAKSQKGKRDCLDPAFLDSLRKHGFMHWDKLHFGHFIGSVDLVDCVATADIAALLSPQELKFGNYPSGRFAWKLDNPTVFEHPLPARGRQRLFKVTLAARVQPGKEGADA